MRVWEKVRGALPPQPSTGKEGSLCAERGRCLAGAARRRGVEQCPFCGGALVFKGLVPDATGPARKRIAAAVPSLRREPNCGAAASPAPAAGGGIGDYRIRTSLRGRNVCLRISARDGLTVTVPRGFDLGRLPAILEQKRNWIETHRRRLSGLSEAAAAPQAEPPETIDLPALGESWRIEYQPTKTRKIGIMEQPGLLIVYGAIADHDDCRAVLKKWLRRRTREALVPWLARLAREGGFTFNEVLIRGQKTRWASCSSQGTITLSYKLLFLDGQSVRYILLHELCHRVYMNHSPRFWMLLSRFEPECRTLRRRMRAEGNRVPAWVEASGGNAPEAR